VAREPAGVALAATLHDPTGALLADIRQALPRLSRLYRHVAVTTSPPTAGRVRRLLAAAGMYAGTPPSNVRGPLYRMALRGALASGAERIHYLDFDRVLHWLPRGRELAALLRRARRHDVLLVGRTAVAHRSHHRPLYATEEVVNRLLADRLGLAGRIDFLVPSFVVTRTAAARLLARSRARDATVYGEWAALLAGLGTVAYVECRGLDWETPDRFRRAVRRQGLARWRARWDTPAEWRARETMATEIVRGFDRGLARWPVRRVALRRW
jgi:hypothetical protein